VLIPFLHCTTNVLLGSRGPAKNLELEFATRTAGSSANANRTAKIARKSASRQKPAFNLRWIVYAVPIACVFSLIWRIERRLNGWPDDPHGIARGALLMDDWSLDRANLEQWLEQQATPQLVFVRYWQNHNVNFEWVYNRPDIMHSHVMWARDLGAEHNKLLLNLVPERTVWLVAADRKHPQYIRTGKLLKRVADSKHYAEGKLSASDRNLKTNRARWRFKTETQVAFEEGETRKICYEIRTGSNFCWQ
jgi:hypothetical protein